MHPTNTRMRATVELRQEFARRLLKLLADRQMSQSDLARATSMSKDAISTYCRGRSLPQPEVLSRICHTLSVDAAELLPRRFDTASMAMPLRMTMLEDGRVRLELAQTMSMATATAIIDMLVKENAPVVAERSGRAAASK